MNRLLTLLSVFFAFLTCTCALKCFKKPDGLFELREGDVVMKPEEFDCMAITKEQETTVTIDIKGTAPDGRNLCQINDDGRPKDKKIYVRSEVPTGTRCTQVCRDSTGLFKCDLPMVPGQNSCDCHPAEHRILIHPVNEIGGQSERPEDTSCDGKPEGYIFGEAVSCSSIRADVHKQRVNFIRGEENECTAVTSLKEETRYTEATESLEGCLYVCKPAAPECTEEVVDEKCSCKSPGLTRRLVPMDALTVREVLKQERCSRGGCGPCGNCNEESGECELIAGAHEGEHCGCGEICPQRDLRAKELRGGKILCRPNVALDCMKKPKWLNSLFDNSAPGTRFPNMCRTGHVDATDTCSCAEGFDEQPGPFSGVYCVRR